MALSEFNLIDRYFKQAQLTNAQTRLGIGDDCAIYAVPEGFELALTMDTMVEGVHFLPGCAAEALGHKLLAVNLSDLASMGAEPSAVLLALTLPAVDEAWLADFAQGLFGLAQRYQVDLIGGDTTRGPLTLTLQAIGLLPCGRNLRRSAAQVGDVICVTGTLGDAGLGLKIAQGDFASPYAETALAQFYRPEPQIAAGLVLRDLAHAGIDISDGLVADLWHITENSAVAAEINYEALPLSRAVKHYIATTGDWSLPLVAGDDYQLCFTLSPEKLVDLDFAYTAIGKITSGTGVAVYKHGVIQQLNRRGYEHFSA